jgi:hypothetical protein
MTCGLISPGRATALDSRVGDAQGDFSGLGMDDPANLGWVALGGVVTAVGLWLIERTRRRARQRADTAWQLAAAQQRLERRRALLGPLFPRATQHVARIAERAERALREIEQAEWIDRARQEACVADLQSLLRHCQELGRVMQPRRRDDPR